MREGGRVETREGGRELGGHWHGEKEEGRDGERAG